MGDELDPKEEKEGDELDPKGTKDDLREINLGDEDDFGPEETGLDDMLPEEDLLFPKKSKGHTDDEPPTEEDSLDTLIDDELDEPDDSYDDVDNW